MCDLNGRLSTRYLAQGGFVHYNESLDYDGRDKIISRTNYDQTITTDGLTYTDLGQLATSDATKYPDGEIFETDGLGMHRWHTSNYRVSQKSSATANAEDSVYYTPGTTSVGMSASWRGAGSTPDTTLYHYTLLGNLGGTELVNHYDPDISVPPIDPRTGKRNAWGFERIVSNDYNNENQMIQTATRMDTIWIGMDRGTQYTHTEFYKYDALGRRVFVRSLKPVGCLSYDKDSDCHSFDSHTIWDGNQILSEVRMAPVGVPGMETNPGASGKHYGTVEYTHAGVIDQPISIARDDGAVVLPLTDWSGMIDQDVCATPGLCGSVTFPGSAASIYGNFKNGSPNWYGSLTEGQTDASGFQYKRNRYFDPKSGSFTQDDPAGIAGGFNTYGYGNSDPVNFSDPFGLAAQCPPCVEEGEAFLEEELPVLAEELPAAEEAITTYYQGVGKDLSSRFNGALQSMRAQINNIVGHVGEREHLSTAAQENNGTLRIPKPGGGFFDHVKETRDAMNGLSNSITRLNKILSDPGLSDALRKQATDLLSKASKALDAMERAVGSETIIIN